MTLINNSYEICKTDFLKDSFLCYLQCPYGSFSLPGMLFCHPWLDCAANITILSLISLSVVKTVYLADWQGYSVVISVLSSDVYEDDFLHNLFMIKLYSPNSEVVNLIGYCKNTILTEYYELGSALNIPYHLNYLSNGHNHLKVRINLCISYASIIALLHNTHNGIGIRVMCDSNDLEKALSQYLITPDFKLVINDLDATPKVDVFKGVHCGNKKLIGTLLAPEQTSPYTEIDFDVNKMPFYDEKVDIYKIPDVCNWFLGNSPNVDFLKYKLYNIHRSCKNTKPCERPSADFIVSEYKKIFSDIFDAR